MKRIICIISLITCVLNLSAQVTVESKIDSIEILIGEQTDVVLSVTAKEGSNIKMPVFKPSEYITPGVEVLSDSKADTSQLDNNLIKVTKRYTLTSFDENLYYIPPMTVTVNGKKYQSKKSCPYGQDFYLNYFPNSDKTRPSFFSSAQRIFHSLVNKRRYLPLKS